MQSRQTINIKNFYEGRFSLDVGIKSLDLFEDFFQQPYPLPKMDQISIPDFSAGAIYTHKHKTFYFKTFFFLFVENNLISMTVITTAITFTRDARCNGELGK